MFDTAQRLTRRRSSAGPTPPQRPQQLRPILKEGPQAQAPRDRSSLSHRPTYLTLRDHGKVYVADLPRLSDGQLAQINSEANEVLNSLNRRLEDFERQGFLAQPEQDIRIRATTKRDVTERFISSIAQEQELRRSNPALRAAAGESMARAFMELARHRLPGSTFDSLIQEAMAACGPSREDGDPPSSKDVQFMRLMQRKTPSEQKPAPMRVVITPESHESSQM